MGMIKEKVGFGQVSQKPSGRMSFNSPTLSELGRTYVQQTAGSLTVRMGQRGMASWRETPQGGGFTLFKESSSMKGILII